jgi:hypothetical protein
MRASEYGVGGLAGRGPRGGFSGSLRGEGEGERVCVCVCLDLRKGALLDLCFKPSQRRQRTRVSAGAVSVPGHVRSTSLTMCMSV